MLVFIFIFFFIVSFFFKTIFFFYFIFDFIYDSYLNKLFFFNDYKPSVIKIVKEGNWDALNEVNIDNISHSQLTKDYNAFLDKLISDKNVDAYRNEQHKYAILQAKVGQASLDNNLKLITIFKKHPENVDLIVRDLALCHKCTDVELVKAGLNKEEIN